MNQKQLIEKFCFDYSWSPKVGELSHFTKFCDSIKSIDILRKTLDPANHPGTETGRIFRPSVATLQVIAGQFISERAQEKRQEMMSAISPGGECWYCTVGYVLGIQERVGLWSTFVSGRCECSQGGDTGYLANKRPVKPSQEIQDFARDSGLNCPLAADRMVYERNQPYRDWDKIEMGQEIPF